MVDLIGKSALQRATGDVDPFTESRPGFSTLASSRWNALSQRVESRVSVEVAVSAAILNKCTRHACRYSTQVARLPLQP